jgi:hypothetical protein
VWHLPDRSPAQTRLQEITKQCDDYGIGLIRIFSPDEIDNYEILLDPVRKETSALAVDGFLTLRLSHQQRNEIKHVIQGEQK